MADSNNPFHRLVLRLEQAKALSPEEVDAIDALPHSLRTYGPGSDILREGDRPSQCALVVEGHLHRFKFVSQGSRQIMSFHHPGDMPDLQSLYLSRLDHYVGTMSQATIAYVPHAAVLELMERHPRLLGCFWRETLINAAVFREWIINIGRREAFGRLAHIFCEQVIRLKQVGLADESGFPWFLTQSSLADASGLSLVHVNRTLQSMRKRGLIGPSNRKFQILDCDGLVSAADFSTDYLHLRG